MNNSSIISRDGGFGNPILISIDFDNFILLFLSVFIDQYEKLYQTLESVSLGIQTP